jgi:hypothetical protein
MRAVNASTFGAPSAQTTNGAGQQHQPAAAAAPPSSTAAVVERLRAGASAVSSSSSWTLQRLLSHRNEGGGGAPSDSGSDTASVDVSTAGASSLLAPEHHPDHDRDHLQHVRRWGHSLKDHVESFVG